MPTCSPTVLQNPKCMVRYMDDSVYQLNADWLKNVPEKGREHQESAQELAFHSF